MTWHADPQLLEHYAVGVIDEAGAYSVEAHLMACAACRRVMADGFDRDRLEAMWNRVTPRLDPDRPGVVERLLVALGVPDYAARLLAATPSLRLSWFGAMALALSFAVLAARAGGESVLVFLVVAPLIPLAGVAAAFGPRIDPTYEIGLTAPMRSYRLLLIRAVAVVTASLALAGAAAVALPGLDWTAAAWLLPSLGLSAATLALSTYVSPAYAAGAVAVVWMAAVVAAEQVSSARFAAFRSPGQVGFALLFAAAAAVLIGRREAFDARRTT